MEALIKIFCSNTKSVKRLLTFQILILRIRKTGESYGGAKKKNKQNKRFKKSNVTTLKILKTGWVRRRWMKAWSNGLISMARGDESNTERLAKDKQRQTKLRMTRATGISLINGAVTKQKRDGDVLLVPTKRSGKLQWSTSVLHRCRRTHRRRRGCGAER